MVAVATDRVHAIWWMLMALPLRSLLSGQLMFGLTICNVMAPPENYQDIFISCYGSTYLKRSEFKDKRYCLEPCLILCWVFHFHSTVDCWEAIDKVCDMVTVPESGAASVRIVPIGKGWYHLNLTPLLAYQCWGVYKRLDIHVYEKRWG